MKKYWLWMVRQGLAFFALDPIYPIQHGNRY